MGQFMTYADLSAEAKAYLKPIHDLINNVDGMDLTRWNEHDGKTTGVDEGTCDADEAVVGFNGLIKLLRSVRCDAQACEHCEPGHGCGEKS